MAEPIRWVFARVLLRRSRREGPAVLNCIGNSGLVEAGRCCGIKEDSASRELRDGVPPSSARLG